jgi:hypothetical protein
MKFFGNGLRSSHELVGGFGVFSVVATVLLLAFAGGSVFAAALSQGYSSDQNLPPGTLVSINSQKANAVAAANSENYSNILGVVVTKSTVSVSDTKTQIQVSSSGTASVLASDINGPVKKGDKITSSPIDGVGMRATQNARVVGTAQENLTPGSTNAQTRTITDKTGAPKKVLIGIIAVDVSVADYQVPASQSKYVPSFVRDLSNYIGGKQVSTIRILSVMAIIFIALICVVTFIYGAVRSGISSIGRNPLAKPAIQRSITKVIGLAIGILISTGIMVYIILKG